LFQVLCSHVGHIFRKRSPYSWKNTGNPVKKNSIRLAEVWMDEYKEYYYERFNHDLVSLEARSFEWHLVELTP
jgi:polypeptide N-acetylgalactosaminyltransferase